MEKKDEHWYYAVFADYGEQQDQSPNYYSHTDKAEALRRARKYMMLSIENLATDYKMGKPLVDPHKVVFRLAYAESTDGGVTYTEEILEEKPLADYLGNHAIH